MRVGDSTRPCGKAISDSCAASVLGRSTSERMPAHLGGIVNENGRTRLSALSRVKAPDAQDVETAILTSAGMGVRASAGVPCTK